MRRFRRRVLRRRGRKFRGRGRRRLAAYRSVGRSCNVVNHAELMYCNDGRQVCAPARICNLQADMANLLSNSSGFSTAFSTWKRVQFLFTGFSSDITITNTSNFTIKGAVVFFKCNKDTTTYPVDVANNCMTHMWNGLTAETMTAYGMSFRAVQPEMSAIWKINGVRTYTLEPGKSRTFIFKRKMNRLVRGIEFTGDGTNCLKGMTYAPVVIARAATLSENLEGDTATSEYPQCEVSVIQNIKSYGKYIQDNAPLMLYSSDRPAIAGTGKIINPASGAEETAFVL